MRQHFVSVGYSIYYKANGNMQGEQPLAIWSIFTWKTPKDLGFICCYYQYV